MITFIDVTDNFAWIKSESHGENESEMNDSNVSCVWFESSFMISSQFITYVITPPIFLAFGLVGHSIALVAFVKRRETEFAFQIFVTVTKIVQISLYGVAILCFDLADRDWSGQRGERGWAWFTDNYVLMWFTAKVATVLHGVSVTLSILATSFMSVDRVLALWKPLFYRLINKKRYRIVLYLFSCVVSVAASLDNVWRWEIVESTHSDYKIAMTAFITTTSYAITGQLRSAVRIIGVMILVSSSVTYLILYRIRFARISSMKSRNDVAEATFKANQKIMCTLATFHSISTIFPTILLSSYAVVVYVSPDFAGCGGHVLAVSVDFALQLINAIDFYILYFASDQFRLMITALMKPIFRRNERVNGTSIELS